MTAAYRPLDDSNQFRKKPWFKFLIAALGAGLLILLVTLTASKFSANNSNTSSFSAKQKRNVILMIPDGFGPASETLARNYNAFAKKLPFDTEMPLDTILVGTSRTRSASSFVTDSAAGATAFACGLKTYNGAIGVDSQKKPCGTVLEAAKKAGYRTGLVVTSRITHATPAAFAAHVESRNSENTIASHLLGNTSLGPSVDLLFGGGACHFLPSTSVNSCRKDSVDLITHAQGQGWDVKTMEHALNFSGSLPMMRLFSSDHMDYELDRIDQPSLADMTRHSLEILEKSTAKSEKGFFLMVEGSRIDHAGHANDIATHLKEILAFQDAVSVVKSFIENHKDSVMIVVADHETGGISVAKQVDPTTYPEYAWNPSALENVSNSSEAIANYLVKFKTTDSDQVKPFLSETVLPRWLGLSDFTNNQVDEIASMKTAAQISSYLSKLISNKAQIGFSTHGHSAVDVNLYSYGSRANLLVGNHENTDVAVFIRDFLGLDLELVTATLEGLEVGQESEGRNESGYDPIHYHHVEELFW